MKSRTIFAVQAIVLALLLGTTAVSAREDDTGRGASTYQSQSATAGKANPMAPVGTGFTYQGQLKDGGAPADGQFDLQFSLFDAGSGGTQVGITLEVLNQTVSEGLFTVVLDFGSSAFAGQASWLEIAVRPAGGGTYTTLSPRQAMSAVPYAMSLATGSNGAVISGTLPGPALIVNNTNAIGVQGTGGTSSYGVRGYGGMGVYGITTVLNGVGVRGDSQNGYGLHGYSAGSGIAVRGEGTIEHGGLFTNNSNTGYAALQGIANGTPGYGVYGEGNSVGVWGNTLNGTGVGGSTTGGYGVHGYSFGGGTGVRGESPSGYGVHGHSNTNHGGYFTTNSTTGGYGVAGVSFATNGAGIVGAANSGSLASGVYGQSSSGTGVVGYSTASGSSVHAIYGLATGNNAMAVHGVSNNGLDAVGVKGESSSNIGVYGISSAINGEGVYGSASSTNGKGISGNSSGLDGYGVYGYAGGTDGIGVYGYGSWTGVRAVGGVYGLWVSGNGSFDNNVYISGDLTVIGSCCAAGAGSFRIDHPTDPENKYLVQTAVQGADMMSIYNGNATTDAKGEAVVALPAYIEALNKDFRYQLTVMGQFAQAIVAEEIKNNRFTIKTDKPNVKVSWQVTGIRQDPYAKAHPIEVEVEKEADEQGKYLHPKEWGQPESKGVGYEERQRMENDTQKPQEPKQAPGR